MLPVTQGVEKVIVRKFELPPPKSSGSESGETFIGTKLSNKETILPDNLNDLHPPLLQTTFPLQLPVTTRRGEKFIIRKFNLPQPEISSSESQETFTGTKLSNKTILPNNLYDVHQPFHMKLPHVFTRGGKKVIIHAFESSLPKSSSSESQETIIGTEVSNEETILPDNLIDVHQPLFQTTEQVNIATVRSTTQINLIASHSHGKDELVDGYILEPTLQLENNDFETAQTVSQLDAVTKTVETEKNVSINEVFENKTVDNKIEILKKELIKTEFKIVDHALHDTPCNLPSMNHTTVPIEKVHARKRSMNIESSQLRNISKVPQNETDITFDLPQTSSCPQEDSSSDSDDETMIDMDNTSTDESSDYENFKYIKNQKLEEQKAYDAKTKLVPGNKVCSTKKSRVMKSTCSNKICLYCKTRYCHEFTEQDRQYNFDKFWSLSWEGKRKMVAELTEFITCPPETGLPSNLNTKYYLFLSSNDGFKFPVCKRMFCNTLDMSRNTINSWNINRKNIAKQSSNQTKDVSQVPQEKTNSLISVPNNLPQTSSRPKEYSSSEIEPNNLLQTSIPKEDSSSEVSFKTESIDIIKEENPSTDESCDSECDRSDLWKYEYIKDKTLREQGKAYVGRKKTANKQFTTPIERKAMKPTCTSNFCFKCKTRHCHEFTEQDRQYNFDKFWSLSWKGKRKMVDELTTSSNPVQSTTAWSRTASVRYYLLKTSDGLKYPVCKRMFCSTLDMSRNTIVKWMNDNKIENILKNSNDESSNHTEVPQEETDCQEDMPQTSSSSSCHIPLIHHSALSSRTLTVPTVKPCSVVLHRGEVEEYFRKRKNPEPLFEIQKIIKIEKDVDENIFLEENTEIQEGQVNTTEPEFVLVKCEPTEIAPLLNQLDLINDTYTINVTVDDVQKPISEISITDVHDKQILIKFKMLSNQNRETTFEFIETLEMYQFIPHFIKHGIEKNYSKNEKFFPMKKLTEEKIVYHCRFCSNIYECCHDYIKHFIRIHDVSLEFINCKIDVSQLYNNISLKHGLNYEYYVLLNCAIWIERNVSAALYKCLICNEKFSVYLVYSNHMEYVHPTCKMCCYQGSRYLLANHTVKHMKGEIFYFKCDSCDFEQLNLEQMKNHVKTCSASTFSKEVIMFPLISTKALYPCPYCPLSFITESLLFTHLLDHTKGNCKYCFKQFVHSNLIKSDSAICNECNLRLNSNISNVKNCSVSISNISNKINDTIEQLNKSKNAKFSFEITKKDEIIETVKEESIINLFEFKFDFSLLDLENNITYKKLDIEDKNFIPSKYQCLFCSGDQLDSNQIFDHMNHFLKIQLNCETCKLTTLDLVKFYEHINQNHKFDIYKYDWFKCCIVDCIYLKSLEIFQIKLVCLFCNVHFKNVTSLLNHVTNTHLNCKFCGITCTSAEEYLGHNHTTIHQSSSMMQCQNCKLIMHCEILAKAHTAQCCEGQAIILMHQKSIANIATLFSPFFCPYCPEVFRNETNLILHLLDHTTCAQKCTKCPRQFFPNIGNICKFTLKTCFLCHAKSKSNDAKVFQIFEASRITKPISQTSIDSCPKINNFLKLAYNDDEISLIPINSCSNLLCKVKFLTKTDNSARMCCSCKKAEKAENYHIIIYQVPEKKYLWDSCTDAILPRDCTT